MCSFGDIFVCNLIVDNGVATGRVFNLLATRMPQNTENIYKKIFCLGLFLSTIFLLILFMLCAFQMVREGKEAYDENIHYPLLITLTKGPQPVRLTQ